MKPPEFQPTRAEADLLELSRIPSLHFNFAWTLFGSLTYAISQWGMLSALAKWGNPQVVGQFALGLAVSAPVFMLSSLQLRAVQATDARSVYCFSDFFVLRCMATAVALLIVMATAWLFGYDRTTSIVIIMVAVSKAIEALSDVIAGLLQKHERLNQVAIAFVLKGLIAGSAFIAGYIVTGNLVAATCALAAGLLVVLIAYETPAARRMFSRGQRIWRVNPIVLRRLLIVSLPLGVVMALISLNINLPRYVVEQQLGTAALGIFASLAYAVMAMNLVVAAIGQSASARLARMFAERDFARFRSLIARLVTIGLGLGIAALLGALLLGRWALTVLYTSEYADHLDLLLIMVATASICAASSFLGYGMTAAHIFRQQLPIIAASTSASYGFSVLLVPYWGLIGAGTALLLSSLIFAFGAYITLSVALRRCEQFMK